MREYEVLKIKLDKSHDPLSYTVKSEFVIDTIKKAREYFKLLRGG